MTHAVDIRSVAASDRAPVMGALASVPRLYPDGGAWLDRRFDDAVLGRSRLLIAAQHGTLAGLMLETPKGAHRRKLSTLFVHPMYRQQGIAMQFLHLAFSAWLREGVHEAWVTAPAHDRATGAFLQHHGFSALTTLPDRYGPGRDETVFLWDADFADDLLADVGTADLLRRDPERRQIC